MSAPPNDAVHDLNVLIGVAEKMATTFELVPLLRTIESAVRTALDCDRATIFLYDANNHELHSMVATGVDEIRFSANVGIAGQAAQTRDLIHVPDAYADKRFNPAVDRKTGYRTNNLLTFPLIAPGGELIGVLQALNKRNGPFDQSDIALAKALGSLTGVALKRQMLLDEAAIKQKLERDLSIARQIQQQLLPKENPQVAGFDIAGWNRPADQTGGDLYDFLQIDERRIAFMIADATGHGIGPALIVAQCRAFLRAVAVTDTTEVNLATVAIKVNNLLHEDLPDDRFVTACFGILDARALEINYISAGQGPLLLYRAATGSVESFAATGLPFGILEDAPIDVGEPIHLQPGDMFLLLTDGFTEWARPDGQQYGDERMAAVIHQNRDRGSAELIQTIYQDVLRFGENTPQNDDLTAIVIKRTS